MLQNGSVVSLGGKPYRILKRSGEDVILIEMQVDKYHFFRCNARTLISFPGFEETPDPYEQHAYMVDDDEMDELKKKQEHIAGIIRGLGTDIELLEGGVTCEGVREFMEEMGITKKTAHKYIRRYLQSGGDIYSLRDGRKTREHPKQDMFTGYYRGGHAFKNGRVRVPIDPEKERKYFEEGFRKIDGETSLSYIVDVLNIKYFSTVVCDEDGDVIDVIPKPLNESLSEKRFRRFCAEKLGAESLDKYRKGVRDRMNNHRIKYGTAQTDCPYPGAIVEVDACEIDIIIVGEDHRKDLGRPVCYFAIDVYSCRIIGYYVGFENNSFLGASSLFNNMFFSKEKIIPDAIRCDQGSEWVSDNIRRFGKELGINVIIVPPAMGSYKGIVESSFRSFQKKLRNEGREYGAIYKEYESGHYDKACLMLEHINKDIEDFIETFNSTSRKTYELSRDMIRRKVKPTPNDIWKYGVEYMAVPRTVTDKTKEKAVFALCIPKKRSSEYSLSRKGITIHGLTYISEDKRVTDLIKRDHYKTGTTDFEVRIDPRTVGHIWLRVEEEIVKVPLGKKHDSLQSFSSLTWFEYDLLWKDKHDYMKESEETERAMRYLFIAKMKSSMEKAKKEQKAIGGKNNKKNIRENRTEARMDTLRNEALGQGAEVEHVLPAIEEKHVDYDALSENGTVSALPAEASANDEAPEAPWKKRKKKKSFEDYYK